MHNTRRIMAISGLISLGMASYAQQPRAPIRPVSAPSLSSLVSPKTVVEVYGSGKLWKNTTGIDEETGIEIRDRRLIAELVSDLRLTNPKPTAESMNSAAILRNKGNFPPGEIDINLPFAQLSYEPSGAPSGEMGMMEQPEDGLMVYLRPGHDRHFLRLISLLAKKAHTHSHNVSLYDLPSS